MERYDDGIIVVVKKTLSLGLSQTAAGCKMRLGTRAHTNADADADRGPAREAQNIRAVWERCSLGGLYTSGERIEDAAAYDVIRPPRPELARGEATRNLQCSAVQ